MKLSKFRVVNYRNVTDSGWIEAGRITAFVGQNEGGKSNLFEALYRLNPFVAAEKYDINEDWPVDDWAGRDAAALVCEAQFELTPDETAALIAAAAPKPADDAATPPIAPPPEVMIEVSSYYDGTRRMTAHGELGNLLDGLEADKWIAAALPRFVFIRDYELPETQTELNSLASKYYANAPQGNWSALSPAEQMIFIVLELAKIDIRDFNKLGETPDGRTRRTFDKRAASAYLSKQFRELWTQKRVKFDIEIDGTTLNIFAVDEEIDMPVRLKNRSTGFRWHVGFAWKFTHATKGQYAGCILLLEEPGIHLHIDGQRDLLRVFEGLAEKNQILYTTHLSSMIDPAFPERVRIVEMHEHHARVVHGVVSSQRRPMAVIEARLGLTGDLSSLLGSRQTLIVEGGSDALILMKLSALLRAAGRTFLSDKVYLWPAETASKTPLYAGFLIGQGWDGAVLLDSDAAGHQARDKIKALYLDKMSELAGTRFRVLMLGPAAGIKKTDAAIEDVFPDEFYVDCVNKAFGLGIAIADLPVDGSDMITKRVEAVLKSRHGLKDLDKSRVLREILRRFDSWAGANDLPPGTADRAESLFSAINKTMSETTKAA